uniref:Exonuclease n=1 Tax=Streptomyces phage Geonosis TaxID=3158856 RepID=A0AAU7GY34_9CAUD
MGDMGKLYENGLINADGSPVDSFDSPDEFDSAGDAGPETERVKKVDPARPEAKRGRYTLPNPESGKSKSWQRVTNFVKMTDDTYQLELWKQRNVAKGIALLAEAGRVDIADLALRDVKLDRDRLNKMCTTAQDVAEAYKMADEGTALHTSTELADYAGGDLNRVPVPHRVKVRMYLDALAANGLTVVPGMIERVTASARYECAGKFDRIYRLASGINVIGDLKTGDELDLSFPSIAAQLECYEDGINNHGVFDGQRYDDSIKVSHDFGVVVHLPSTRDEVTVYWVDLAQGRIINAANLTVRAARKIKMKHVAEVFDADRYGVTQDGADAHWLEQLNAAFTMADLINVADRARTFNQWNQRLADQAHVIARSLQSASEVMGS